MPAESRRVNAQYNVAAPNSLPVRVMGFQRRKMYLAFTELTGVGLADTILDVGATSDRTYDHSNYFEAWYPYKHKLTAVGLDDAHFLEAYPGLRFLRADGRALPFADESFDFVHSSAVLEHAGSREEQIRLLSEAWRVARKGIFVTTPNRWFPIEFHTQLPLLHWLPPPLFRAVLVRCGQEFFASEGNLNLVSRRSLAHLAHRAGIGCCLIARITLLGFTTNLILIAKKSIGQ